MTAPKIQNWRPKKLPDRPTSWVAGKYPGHINENAEFVPAAPESDAAYRDRLMGIIGPGSVNFPRLATAVGAELDEIGNPYEGGARK